jgi:acetolactate synthase-1/2/3 large subunit
VLAVGTRLQPPQQNWGRRSTSLKIVRIDADSEELDRQRKPADRHRRRRGTATLKALADRLAGHNSTRAGRADDVAETKAAASTTEVRETAGAADRLPGGDCARRCPRTGSWSTS